MNYQPNPIAEALDWFAETLLNNIKEGKSSSKEVTETKDKLLKKLQEEYATKNEGIKELLKLADTHFYSGIVDALSNAGVCFIGMKMKSDTPLLVGQSEGALASIFEVGTVFDMVYGLPFIPGSSIKGTVRSFVSSLCKELGEGTRSKCDELVNHLFGPPEGGVGEVIFFDAYPVGVDDGVYSIIKPDIITPHYYSGGKPIRNELEVQPNPIKHVSISEGVHFGFIVAIRHSERRAFKTRKEIEELGEILDLGNNWVTVLASLVAGALRIEGVGSRTTKGYGMLNLIELKTGCGV